MGEAGADAAPRAVEPGWLLWDAKWRTTWRARVRANLERSCRDADRLIALVATDDPAAAAARERERTRPAVRRHRERRGTYVSPAPVGGADPGAPVAPAVRAVVGAPAPPAESAGREGGTDAPWVAFARLDRTGQVAFARRALRHLGVEPPRIDATLDGVEEEGRAGGTRRWAARGRRRRSRGRVHRRARRADRPAGGRAERATAPAYARPRREDPARRARGGSRGPPARGRAARSWSTS